jgi:hypothetical protein
VRWTRWRGRWPAGTRTMPRRRLARAPQTAPHWEPSHGAAARRHHRTESLGGARAQRGEARTVMDLRRRGGAGAGSEQEKRGGGG